MEIALSRLEEILNQVSDSSSGREVNTIPSHEEEAERYFKNQFMEQIPVIYRRAKLQDFDNAVQEQVNNFYQSKKSLLITGDCGTGKTYLACAIAIDVFETKKRFVGYLNFNDLILKIKKSFSGEGYSEDYYVDEYSKDPQIIDDIGAFKISDFTIETLYTLLDRRYRNQIRTIYTSNLGLSEISENLGDRIASRLASCSIIELSGSDMRLVKR